MFPIVAFKQSFALNVWEGDGGVEGASDELRKVSIYLVLSVFYLPVGDCKQRAVIQEENGVFP